MELFTLIALLVLLVLAALILKELVAVRRQVSSVRQSLEWWAVGFLETRKDDFTPALREYMKNTKQDLIREGFRDGTLTEQQAKDLNLSEGTLSQQLHAHPRRDEKT